MIQVPPYETTTAEGGLCRRLVQYEEFTGRARNAGALLLDRLGLEHKLVRSEMEAQVCHIGSGVEGPRTLTPLSRYVIDYAREEARMLGDGYVGTGHLLLGLIRENDGMAARTLSRLGVDIASARPVLKSLHASGVTEAGQRGLG